MINAFLETKCWSPYQLATTSNRRSINFNHFMQYRPLYRMETKRTFMPTIYKQRKRERKPIAQLRKPRVQHPMKRTHRKFSPIKHKRTGFLHQRKPTSSKKLNPPKAIKVKPKMRPNWFTRFQSGVV